MQRSLILGVLVTFGVLALTVGCTSLPGGDDVVLEVPTTDRPLATLEAVEDDPPVPTAESFVPPTAEAVVVPAPDPFSCLSQRQLAAQLLLALLEPNELSGAAPLAAAGDLGGVVLLGTPGADIGDRLANLQQASFVPLMIASDEEGGAVQRLDEVLGPLPSAATLAASETPDQVRERFRVYGEGAAALGVDVIFAPVVDVGSALGAGRSFSDDAQVVTDYGRAVSLGLIDAGVFPVLKHFPGHGRASGDSHLGLPLTPSLTELRTSDLVPYETLLSDPGFSRNVGVMIAHLVVPELSEQVPTSLSTETVDGLLRTELGFDGLVFTDALNMRAITDEFTTIDAVIASIRAGSDVAILGGINDVAPVLDQLISEAAADDAFAQRVEQSALRVLTAKGQDQICAGAS